MLVEGGLLAHDLRAGRVAERAGRVGLEPQLTACQEVGPGLEGAGPDGVAAVLAREGGQVARVGRLGQIRLADEGVVVHVVGDDHDVVRAVRLRDHRGLGVGGARAGGDLLARVVEHVHVEVVGGLLRPLDRDGHAALGVVVPVAVRDRHLEVEAVAHLVVGVVRGGRALAGITHGPRGVHGALPGHALVAVVQDAAAGGRRPRLLGGGPEEGRAEECGRADHRQGARAGRSLPSQPSLPQSSQSVQGASPLNPSDPWSPAGRCLPVLELLLFRATSSTKVHRVRRFCQCPCTGCVLARAASSRRRAALARAAFPVRAKPSDAVPARAAARSCPRAAGPAVPAGRRGRPP